MQNHKAQRKNIAANLLIAILAFLLTYVGLEVVYRIYVYVKVSRTEAFEFWTSKSQMFMFDQASGVKFQPNQDFDHKYIGTDNKVLITAHVHINNLGLVSSRDAALNKPPSEFRIAVLGDSFTASLYNNKPWPDTLEDLLNADDNLKRAVNKSSFKVLNFGRPGIGVVQMVKIYESEVRDYDPDLVIVDFPSMDIDRRFAWIAPYQFAPNDYFQLALFCTSQPIKLDSPDCVVDRHIFVSPDVLADNDKLTAMKRDIHTEHIRQLPWFDIYPELVARFAGKPLGLTSRIQERVYSSPTTYNSRDEALSDDVAALKQLKSEKQTLIVYMPWMPELIDRKTDPELDALQSRDHTLNILSLLDYFPSRATQQEITGWFNMPADVHFNDTGAAVNAQATYSLLKDNLLPKGN